MNVTKRIIHTIDENHTNMLEKFQQYETETIPTLENDKETLKNKLRHLPTSNVDTMIQYKDQIKSIQQEIIRIKSEKKKYYLDNSKYIFDYFEQKKDINNIEKPSQHDEAIQTFFKIKTTTSDEHDIHNNKYLQSRQYYIKYWRNVRNDITNIKDFIIHSDMCMYCREWELIPQDDEGIMICNNEKCSKFVTYIVDIAKSNNNDPPNEVSYTAYIRLNHFKEILSQFQAKETTQIPDEVMSAIKARIKKERIQDVSTLNYNKMRDILRKLGLNKYFEHIQYINSLFGIKPPVMNDELHETLCVLFIEIQKPWAVHCPPNRTNFFNYTYTLYQLCNLLDQTQYLPYIPMMKDREKQLEQDMIWKKVCQDLDWEYFPTV